jgi:putative transposase
MSPKEREEIVRLRQQQGFPEHAPPHPDFGIGWYLISAATYEHKLHFQSPEELTALERRLLEVIQSVCQDYAGWVVLPNHYHVLVRIENLSSLGRGLGKLHGRSSRYVNKRDGFSGRKVWYKYSDRKIRSERHYWTSLHYIVHNPVKHGFCDCEEDWIWSCLRLYQEKEGGDWLTLLKENFPLEDFGKGWDE